MPAPALRASVLRFPREDGGLELLDLLLEGLHELSPAEARALEALEAGTDGPGCAALRSRLEDALLWEGPTAALLREQRRAAKLHRWVAGAGQAEAPDFAAPDAPLPEGLASAWREPERYRRLYEERLAGREVFVLRGWLDPALAGRLAEEAAGLSYGPLATEHVEGERVLLRDELQPLQALMRDPALRSVLGQVLGRDLPESLTLNAWRMQAGHRMAVHPDGARYRGTLSLGLCADWRASQGGAIAFGVPSAAGFEVRERFLPHLGDACLFAPTARTWHAVEPVRNGTRLTVTGWWTGEAAP